MSNRRFEFGIDQLLRAKPNVLPGKRFGLVAHSASVDASGCSSAERLHVRYGEGLAALFSPEHGYFGSAGAGEKVRSSRHPAWGIPVHSLYGETRRPSAAMLAGLDAVVFDLQDLSIRCYTYVSTLRYLLEAAAEHRVGVVVCERPNPLVGVVDGPMLDKRYESFVGCFPGPLVYGMNAGRAALLLVKHLKLNVDVHVMTCRGEQAPDHAWISPSPAIRNRHSALCYPVTVCFEALPVVDYGRSSLMPFELIGVAGLSAREFSGRMLDLNLPGLLFHPITYEKNDAVYGGARIAVTDPGKYRPIAAAVAVLDVLQKMKSAGFVWKTRGSRPAFFDQLFGTGAVRKALQAGVSWRKIVSSWQPVITRWKAKANR
ncbi:MAG TPA: DUF1343 domain-containing protein [Kiritimatiellia bacterium]|nr:DUF1343 domain-containing protein [Kiritimatiellia bacterium]